MPTSPSPRRSPDRAGTPPRQIPWRLVLVIFVLAAVGVAVSVLPAGLIRRFLPPAVEAEDFSGTLWHGSAGRIRVQGRDVGGLEWELEPAALLGGALAADLHWVKGGFMLDAHLKARGHRLQLGAVRGGGPIEDLEDMGVPVGCRGIAEVALTRLDFVTSGSAATLQSAAGTLTLADAAFSQIANGAPLGGYTLDLGDPARSAGPNLVGRLHDTGGPLGLEAEIHYSPQTHIGTLSGTLTPRAELPPAIRRPLAELAQLHAPEPDGRIPLDLEFTF